MAENKDKKIVTKWMRLLEKEIEAHKKFREQGKDSDDAARDDITNKAHTFNIHWSNCKIIRSAIYAKPPRPDVRRRFTTPDEDEQQLAQLVERGLSYAMDVSEFNIPAKAVARDFVQTSLGVPRVIYDTEFEKALDEEGNEVEVIASQSVSIEHVPWKHFHWEPGNHQWKDVGWIAYEYFTTAKAIKEDYGVEVEATSEDKDRKEAEKYRDEVQMFEILNKKNKTIIVIAKGHPEPLEVRKDKLHLEGFFHSPQPAFDNLKSNELIPKPDYCFISSQIAELNKLQARRTKIINSIKAVYVHDASLNDALGSLEGSSDVTSIPITNLMEKLDGGKLENMISSLPMADRAAVIHELNVQIESVKQQIYEISGISDIIRGASNANETAAAQQLKGQWANVRLNDKTDEINRVWRDVLRMMAEIMCEHFEPEILTEMTGVEVTPRMYEIMQSDIGRSFAIDIETDSTILKDDIEERQQKLELVNTLLEKLGFVLPLVQQNIMPVELVQETLIFIISSHKHGKQLEDVVSGLTESMQSLQDVQQVQQQLQQAQQELQQAQQQLSQYNEREEARKDAESEAQVAKLNADSLETEWKFMGGDEDESDLDDVEQVADIDKTRAETDKIRSETLIRSVTNG